MRQIFRTAEPTPANLSSYGHSIRELLILACTEVESGWVSVFSANAYGRPKKGGLATEDYVRLCQPMLIDQWEISLVMHPDVPSFKPFAGWNAATPTMSLPWYDAYNSVKHGRESNFAKATLGSLIHAMGALFVMVSGQFGPWLLQDEPGSQNLVGLKRSWADDLAIIRLPVWPLED